MPHTVLLTKHALVFLLHRATSRIFGPSGCGVGEREREGENWICIRDADPNACYVENNEDEIAILRCVLC